MCIVQQDQASQDRCLKVGTGGRPSAQRFLIASPHPSPRPESVLARRLGRGHTRRYDVTEAKKRPNYIGQVIDPSIHKVTVDHCVLLGDSSQQKGGATTPSPSVSKLTSDRQHLRVLEKKTQRKKLEADHDDLLQK